MDQFVDAAYNVTTQLFGPNSGIPWWAWALIPIAIMFKMAFPERKTAADRDEAMIAAMTGGDGKKAKKKKK